MKKIEKPFAMSLYSEVEKATVKYELRKRHLKDLMFLRDKMESGHLTAELYDFINADRCLEQLLPGLPRPTPGAACESLQMLQLKMIDDLIAQEELQISKWISIVWNALKDYLASWFDRNRYYLRNLRYFKSLHRQYQDQYFGSMGKFNSTAVLMYHLEDWSKMLKSAKRMLKEIKLPEKRTDIEEWIQKNKPVIVDCISDFGMYIDENNKFRSGSPAYIRQNGVCINLGWLYQNLGTHMNDVIECLQDEVEYRRGFNTLEKLFMSQDAQSKRDSNLIFVKDFVISSKNCALILARTFNSFLQQIMKANSKEYRIGSSYGTR